MGMTMTQKILAAHAGVPEVKAGELISASLDMVLANDITGPVSIKEFDKAGFQQVFDKSKVSLVMDHFTPNKDIKSAEQCKACRTFAKRFDIDNFYDVGEVGIEHSPSFRKKDWQVLERQSSEPTPTPAPTELWELSLLELAPQMLLPEWLLERPGLRFLLQLNLTLQVRSHLM